MEKLLNFSSLLNDKEPLRTRLQVIIAIRNMEPHDEDDVQEAINRLKNNKTQGHDRFSGELL